MKLLPERQFDREGRLDWRASIEASLAAHPVRFGRRIPARLEALARRLPIGGCLHCSTPWGLVPAHTTAVAVPGLELANGTAYRDIFVLCEACWRELPVEARLVYYRAQYDLWLRDTARFPYGPKRDAAVTGLAALWPRIERAVRAGG